jgi:hypothetical protein
MNSEERSKRRRNEKMQEASATANTPAEIYIHGLPIFPPLKIRNNLTAE